ncbi:hypothetical protein DNTS_001098 [Danionella cerebrum]|uniref:Coiled-coil domain-containing protein 106 n=1 Tax=Danionella cerebrum TaxID=2873325 RepID=A0A553Q962_9TELE|nr:hypothetical protein DNTS_001098 [Danionella translucida]
MNDADSAARKPRELLLHTPKNEDSFEVSIPFQENSFGQQGGFCSYSEQNFEASDPPTSSSSYMLVTSLKTRLQISLEKNSWLQKRIEDLEEERDFLRCQLDRFIFSTKTQESNDNQAANPQPTSHQTFQQMSSLQTSANPIVLSSVSGVTSTQMNPMFGQPHTQPLEQTTSRSLSELQKSLSRLRDEQDDEFEVEDDSLEEEEMLESMSHRSIGVAGRPPGGHSALKRRRVFRIPQAKERQRVKDAAGVLLRYKKILATFQRLKSMSKAFQVHGIDRNTVASTTPIAELLLVAPEKVGEVGEFDPSREKLLEYARRCHLALDPQTFSKVQVLKKNNLLLPISYRFKSVDSR